LIRTLANIDTKQDIFLISCGVACIRSSSFPSINGYPDEKLIEFVNSEKFDLKVIVGLSGLSKAWVVVSYRAKCPVLVMHYMAWIMMNIATAITIVLLRKSFMLSTKT
jgi:hypothetical protein